MLKKGLCGDKGASATSHHRLPGADLDAFGKSSHAGKHLESNCFSPPPSAYFFVYLWGLRVCVFILAMCLEGHMKGVIYIYIHIYIHTHIYTYIIFFYFKILSNHFPVPEAFSGFIYIPIIHNSIPNLDGDTCLTQSKVDPMQPVCQTKPLIHQLKSFYCRVMKESRTVFHSFLPMSLLTLETKTLLTLVSSSSSPPP